MAAVVHLEKAAPAPKDASSVIVARDMTGGFYALSWDADYTQPAETPDQPISEPDRAAAIDRATAYADLHGLHTVYVVT